MNSPNRIDVIGQNGNEGSHYEAPPNFYKQQVEGVMSAIDNDKKVMDRKRELEALALTCDSLADSCEADTVGVDNVGDVLCFLKRVTNSLDLDWDDVQIRSSKLNDEVNKAIEENK